MVELFDLFYHANLDAWCINLNNHSANPFCPYCIIIIIVVAIIITIFVGSTKRNCHDKAYDTVVIHLVKGTSPISSMRAVLKKVM